MKPNRKTYFATAHPDLIGEWHPMKNGDLNPHNTTSCSGKKVWWMCSQCKYEWQTMVSHRHNGSGCPKCALLSPKRWLAGKINLAETNPEIATEWHPTKNGNLTPRMIKPSSIKSVWWLCEKGHEWVSNANRRTCSGGHGCPFCTGRFTDDATSLLCVNPTLAAEWHTAKNNLTPNDVRPLSNRIAWWICCKCHHEWKSLISNRHRGSGCPKCKESRGEKSITIILEKLNLKFERQVRYDNCRGKRPLPFDFVINHNDKTYIVEYQGKQHCEPVNFSWKNTTQRFETTKKLDRIKKEFCSDSNIPLLEIPYYEHEKAESMIKEFLNVRSN